MGTRPLFYSIYGDPHFAGAGVVAGCIPALADAGGLAEARSFSSIERTRCEDV